MTEPTEAWPDRLMIFRRDRKQTLGDHTVYDPADWRSYARADLPAADATPLPLIEALEAALRFYELEANHDYTYDTGSDGHRTNPTDPLVVMDRGVFARAALALLGQAFIPREDETKA